MKHFFTSAVLSAGLLFGAVSASASSLPAVDGNYEGSYRLADVFTPDTHRSFTHGLYLPGFLGEESWTIESGRAEYDGTELSLKGKVKQTTGGSDYFLISTSASSKRRTNPQILTAAAALAAMRPNK
ncbi:MAG: hypothetical protein ABJ263_01255 [Tateyamaria sp.]|uniref:hypothetical protein n=1 Tax=Tateyamaria sp. TaxID=1929288 RepID=UPI00326FD2B7